MKNYGVLVFLCAALALSGCSTPKSQHVQGSFSTPNNRVEGGIVGAAVGGLGAWALHTPVLPPMAIGTVIGVIIGDHFSRPALIARLREKGATVIVRGDKLRIILPTDDFFEPDSPNIRKDHYSAMNYVASLLKEYDHTPIMITGYTDGMGPPLQGKQMSLLRAQSALSYLWVHGLQFDHLYARGMGGKNHISEGRGVLARAANRRVEITLREGCESSFSAHDYNP